MIKIRYTVVIQFIKLKAFIIYKLPGFILFLAQYQKVLGAVGFLQGISDGSVNMYTQVHRQVSNIGGNFTDYVRRTVEIQIISYFHPLLLSSFPLSLLYFYLLPRKFISPSTFSSPISEVLLKAV